MDTLLRHLAEYRPFRVMVVGDFMLDQHIHGAAERLSPDAPVPVLHAQRFENSPGGAANVALCLRALEGRVACIGAIGDDPEGATLREALAGAGCEIDGLIVDPSRPTTVKRSMVGLAQHRHPQKMFRVDIESREPLGAEMQSQIIQAVRRTIDDVDVVCIEDYNKGVCCTEICRAVIEIAQHRGKPVLVDPASIDDYSKYRGATAITPNRSEAERATHLDEPLESTYEHNAQMARMLLESLALDAVVLTLDKSGAMLATPGKEPQAIPTVARTVYDVTGAGDMVLAALAAAVANHFDWPDAVRFANAAAGLEVEVFGAQPIPFVRVRQSIVAQSRAFNGKVRDLDDLLVELDAHRAAGEKIVLTNGCFDVIHAGHVAYLREAKKLGDVLVVAVNSDDQVAMIKGPGRPIYPIEDRFEILGELACIDYLVMFEEPTAHAIIESIRPHIYVKGGDYTIEELNEFNLLKKMMDAGEIEVCTVAHRPGLNSSDVIRRLAAVEKSKSREVEKSKVL